MKFVLTCLPIVSGFYISFNPTEYDDGEPVQLYYNKIFSDRTQLSFAYAQLPFTCSNNDENRSLNEKWLNLGEVFSGDRIVTSPLQIQMNKPVECAAICTVGNLKEQDISFASKLIHLDYRVEWIVDDLPVATAHSYETVEKPLKHFELGFPLGSLDSASRLTLLHNHIHLRISYQQKNQKKLIVAVEAQVKSIGEEGCRHQQPLILDPSQSKPIHYTYSVSWHEDTVTKWGNRWDMYLSTSNAHIHWYSIINSLIILLFLTSLVALIMIRTLNNDISTYNDDQVKEDPDHIVGWKLLHGDVFRPPRHAALLSSLVGCGIQFTLAATTTLILSAIGLLNPGLRGSLLSCAIYAYAFMGSFGGYYSARLYKTFKGNHWFYSPLLTSFIPPCIIIGSILILNMFIWYQGSSNALPLGTFTALSMLWLGVSTPLIYIGSYFGFKKQPIELPVRTHQIPRQIPPQAWFLRNWCLILISGIIPFAVVFLELFFILKSVWQVEQYYYMYGFLALVFVLLVITCVEMTIVSTYFTLSSESWKWQWKAFLVSGSSSLYIFLYSILYYYSHLQMDDSLSFAVYFGRSLLACFVYWLCTGSIGFLATYYFVIRIYERIKID